MILKVIILKIIIQNIVTNPFGITKRPKSKLLNHITELLETDKEIDVNTNLINYGVDSILAMEISNFVSQELGMKLAIRYYTRYNK